MNTRWRIELLGSLRAEQDGRVITRFRSRQTGALLAYLAYHCQRTHPREVLIELLWPECELDAGRNSLSVALSSLRHQLEPPGVPAGAVLIADRASVGLNPAAVTTDVAEFEAALDAAARAGSRTERAQLLIDAIHLYRGELLPGFYDEWIPAEQERLAERHFQALRQLIDHHEDLGDPSLALDFARRAVGAAPLREEAHQDLMRLYAAAGQPSAALRQYRELERLLREELGQAPSAPSRQLAQAITEQVKQRPAVEEIILAPPVPLTSSPTHPSTLSSLPAGTVTFLLTDHEGSTAQWQRVGDTFKAALASHHALLRKEFRRHGGYEAKEIGDGFLVAFERAGDALACAVAGQRALATNSWPEEVGSLRVRMALHTGDVELKEADYRSLALHHASRMLTAAHGGQILCSEVTAGLLLRGGIAAMGPGVQLTNLGVYRLKDLPGPERLFQVDYPEMPAPGTHAGTDELGGGGFPPLRAEAGYAGNLPPQLTRFFGRAAEMARLRDLLLSHETRLVTLTGPGGSGKTRLALEVAGQLVEAFQGSVWLVVLQDLTDPKLIPVAVRDALRLPPAQHLTPLEQVVDSLTQQPALLVLDNFEHLLDGGAPLVHSLLTSVPSLKCLVTSRQRLDLEGERETHVLPLPTPSGTASPERLTLYESVQLLVDRAQAVRPDFQVTNSNAPALAELCRRLEGIPLALELAAARAQVLTPQQMLAQLENRLDFLVSRRRDAVARHRTLRAAIEWGYQLLAPELRHCFTQLSVFRGGWTLEAAEQVCEQPLALDYLAQLRECSLVLAEEAARGMRFRMLETLREFAAERLEPEELAGLRRRHAAYCLALAEKEWPEGEAFQQWLAHLDVEHDNLRTALEWALESEPELALRLAVALGSFWSSAGHYSEGRDSLHRALQRAATAPIELREGALARSGGLTERQGDFPEARRLLEESLNLARERGDQQAVKDRLVSLIWVTRMQGDQAGQREFLEQRRWLCAELADVAGTAASLRGLAELETDTQTARSLLEMSLTLSRQTDDQAGIAASLRSLSWLETDPEIAQSLFEEGMRITRGRGTKEELLGVLSSAGIEAYNRGNYPAARALLEESIQAAIQRWGQAPPHPFIHLGFVACRQGEDKEARMHLRSSLARSRQVGDKRLIVECLEGLAEVDARLGRPERAARLFGAAAALRDTTGFGIWPSGQAEHDRQVAALRETLGEAAFTTAWAAGRALPWREATDEALAESERQEHPS